MWMSDKVRSILVCEDAKITRTYITDLVRKLLSLSLSLLEIGSSAIELCSVDVFVKVGCDAK